MTEPFHRFRAVGGVRQALLMGMGLFLLSLASGRCADIEKGQHLYLSGHYHQCAATARNALEERRRSEDWSVLLTRSLLATGEYAAAADAIRHAMDRDPKSIRLKWLARKVFRSNGQTNEARLMVEGIKQLLFRRPWVYRDARSMMVFGEVALLDGIDPKRVLDRIFDPAKKLNPNLREAYLYPGRLALEKHDDDLASKIFQEGLKRLPDDPDLHFGLARAYAPSDPAAMLSQVHAALKVNPNHVPSLLLWVDYDIDAEDYTGATKLLDRVDAVNPWAPDAWAYRAVLADLRNDPSQEHSARRKALKFWSANPRVDYLIGLKLSQKYRFSEGAAHQRQALEFDPGYLPAKSQLAQDLLRLGDEKEGWRLVREWQAADDYDVGAVNLLSLHDVMAKFQTLSNADFVLRMSPHEAALYGWRALDLLEAARKRLSKKYGLAPARPTVVEIFSEQKDFAVRTFGMPGDHGYLGVCFGHVITANGPESRPGQAFNWETMLWHEFCHVVTLQMTHNKMPRWFSEGISVYEERQANPAWGEHMNPQYREMILGDDLTPISKLSSAFMAPRSAIYLQFAYYESSLVIEFLVDHYGQNAVIAILKDLGNGVNINETIAQHTAPMATVQKEFVAFARKKAVDMAPGLDFQKPDIEGLMKGKGGSPAAGRSPARRGRSSPAQPYSQPGYGSGGWETWAKAHPTNYWVLSQRAQRFVESEQWSRAKPILEHLVQLYPRASGPSSPYRLLAETLRALGETNTERQVLAQYAGIDDEAPDAYFRLMELGAADKDWAMVETNAQRYLAVDPLVAPPYAYLARASTALGQTQQAIQAFRSLLRLNPPDPTEVHFQLARLLDQRGDPGAKRQVLEALEDAPSFRQALRLLLKIHREKERRSTNAAAKPSPASP